MLNKIRTNDRLKMTFEFSDTWVLSSIKFSENGDQGTTLTDIIQMADGINHLMLDYQEFTTATKKLKSIGLIIEKDRRFKTTDTFNKWWNEKYEGKSRFGIHKAMDEIQKYLDKTFGTVDSQPTDIKTEFTEKDFHRSTKEYHKMASGIKKKLTTKKKRE